MVVWFEFPPAQGPVPEVKVDPEIELPHAPAHRAPLVGFDVMQIWFKHGPLCSTRFNGIRYTMFLPQPSICALPNA